MKVMISGGAGYIAKSLRLMLEGVQQFEVYSYDIKLCNDSSVLFLPNLRDQLTWINQIRPDVFIHLGAQTDVNYSFVKTEVDFNLNCESTFLIANHFAEFLPSTHFIYINSGGAIYGNKEVFPIKENFPTSPLSFYGLSKLIGEDYIRMLGTLKGLKWSSLALSNVYGPSNFKGILYELVTSIQNSNTCVIYGPESTRDYIHVEDACDAIIIQCKGPSYERIHISSGFEISNMEIFSKISKILNVDTIPTIKPPRQGEIYRSSLSNEYAKFVLDWSPIKNLESELEEVVKSYS